MSNPELFGYAASAIVALSLMMKNIVKLRVWNLIGGAMFSAYGLVIGAWPVFVLNGWIAVVDLWFLLQMRFEKDFFDTLDIINSPSPVLDKFIRFYHDDIVAHFPQFRADTLSKTNIIVTLRNLMPVGFVIYEFKDEKTLLVHLDYVAPEYRDLQTARYLLKSKEAELRERGIAAIMAYSNLKVHQKYLGKIGFNPTGERYLDETLYRKVIG